MLSQLNAVLARTRHGDMLDAAERRRPRFHGRREGTSLDLSRLWQGLTVRLATQADRSAVTRLAELEQTSTPAEPLLLGVVMQRPVAVLSLRDGRVIADPFTPTADVIELLTLRSRQLRCH
jgi:hypothetical protein